MDTWFKRDGSGDGNDKSRRTISGAGIAVGDGTGVAVGVGVGVGSAWEQAAKTKAPIRTRNNPLADLNFLWILGQESS